jgi:hypothetical protein
MVRVSGDERILHSNCLSPFTSNTTSELDVFRHNGHSLGVDSAQVGVFEKSDQVSLTSFLQLHQIKPNKLSIVSIHDKTPQTHTLSSSLY